MTTKILKLKNITKSFSGVKALDDVNLEVNKGEIHSVVGENGAGKSTLMNIISGFFPSGDYEGEMYYQGEQVHFNNISESEDKGIVIIHQELSLFPELSVSENIFIGNENVENGIIDDVKTYEAANILMRMVGLNVSANEKIKDIGVGHQQLVEIAKALSKKVSLLILDEPTAALNENESEKLLELLKLFKKQGITSIMISHKLNEVLAVSDKVTVIRDGKTISTVENDDSLTEEDIITAMVGRSLENRYPLYTPNIGEKYFEVKNWTVRDPSGSEILKSDDINFYVRSGEIVGIAGLMGSGRTELVMSLFGESYGEKISGSAYIQDKEVDVSSVSKAIGNGLAYVSEDRQGNGLILNQSVANNISLPNLNKLSENFILDLDRENEVAEDFKEKLGIVCRNVYQNVGELSGGNQQKVALSKWIYSDPNILFLDEPTRGIDVGAQYDIYKIIQELALSGKAVVIVSSVLPEILGMCDRIYTMCEGKLTSEFNKESANQEVLMKHMTL